MENSTSEKRESIIDRLISGILNIIYSKEKKIERWLFLLIFVGFILRLIAALNTGVLADDMLYASGSAGIMDSKILSTHSNPPLFFYLTDFSYKIFGYTTFASRFWSLIFGTLLIPLVFLITRKFFSKQIALCAAFFVTFSNFMVRMTYTEQSLTAFFFAALGIYFGLIYLDRRSKKSIILSGIFFGLASLTKYSAPFFILSFLLLAIYAFKSNGEKILTKKNIKHLAILILFILLISMPFLAFNYFIYKDKGILDVYFSRVIQLESTQQLYGSLGGQDTSFFQNLFSIGRYSNVKSPFYSDIFLLLFFLAGIYLLIQRKEKKPLVFLGLFILIPFIMQSAGSLLTKHFVFLYFFMAIPAGLALNALLSKISNKKARTALLIIFALILILLLGIKYTSPRAYFSESGTSIAKSVIASQVGKNDLIIIDPRIYTARSMWLAAPNHFLSMQQFGEFYQYNLNLGEQYLQPIKVYVVECSSDDCGWGVEQIKDINQSAEQFIDAVRNQSELIKIAEPKYSYFDNLFNKQTADQEQYRIYSLTLNLNLQLIEQTDMINNFYFTPYLYKNMKNYMFNYSLADNMSIFANSICYFIILASMIAAVLSIFYVFYTLLCYSL